MQEQQYKIIGWTLFVLSVLLALFWCINGVGPAGFFMETSERLFKTKLTQISWLLTFAIVCIPGWIVKNYFEGKAWESHVAKLPPPDARESAKRSKYVKADHLPAAPPKPVQLTSLPEGQEEFVATCPVCSQFFSARRDQKDLKCPHCGESVPLSS